MKFPWNIMHFALVPTAGLISFSNISKWIKVILITYNLFPLTPSPTLFCNKCSYKRFSCVFISCIIFIISEKKRSWHNQNKSKTQCFVNPTSYKLIYADVFSNFVFCSWYAVYIVLSFFYVCLHDLEQAKKIFLKI